jgi:hypothetical protein
MLRFLWHMSATVLILVGIVLMIKMWVVPSVFILCVAGSMIYADISYCQGL